MSRDQWARRAAILFVVTGCASGLSVGCAEEPDAGTGGRPGRGGSSGVGAPDGSTSGGTSGTNGAAGVAGFGGSFAGSSGSAGAGAAGSGGVDAGTAGTNGSSGSGGEPGSGGSSGNDAGADASTGGTNGSAGSSGTAGTAGSAGNDAGTDASTGGTSGSAGTNGSGGTAGADASTGGTSGTAGTNGTGGTAGVDAGTGGTNGSAGTAGTAGSDAGVDAGSGGTAGADAGTDAGVCNGGPTTAPGFVNLAPPMGAPLDPAAGNTLNPPPPTGWTWYQIQGAVCRDGSPAGFFVRFTSSDKLFIYFEGGGACTNLGFCNFNPANVNSAISGDGQTVIGSTFGVVAARQQPGVFEGGQINGIFNTTNTANPFKDWNAVYIPYCTGDIHSGTKPNGTVPGVATPQQFVGHFNTEKFVSRIVPTFKPRVNRVIVTGASAGSFGAAMNFSMLQDAFGCVKVDVLLDSGVPFIDTYMPVCMQQRWRNAWGLSAGLPPDCTECRQADGGGFLKYADFLIRKHPRATIASVSSMQDEVIRLFFSSGVKNCANYDTADPVGITIGQVLDPTIFFSAADYTAGLNELRTRYQSTGRFATYFLGGPNIIFHQHTWRARFFDPAAGTKTIAAFTTNFLNGTFEQIGP